MFLLVSRKNIGYTLAMDKTIVVQQLKKRGPVPRGYISTHVMLPAEMIALAKEQPEGLSGIARLAIGQELKRRKATSV
jgi:hypothetical protein